MKTETFVILIPGFAENEEDSTCLPSQQLFVNLLKEKFPALNIVIIAFQYPFISHEYNWHRSHVIALGGKGRSKFFRLMLWRKAWKKLKRLNKETKLIGILSFWCGECALIGDRFSKKYGMLHYCWLMGQDAKKENNYVKRIKPLPTTLVAISDFIRKEFSTNHGIQPQQVIPFGIGPAQFPHENMERSIDVLGAGSLISLKQFDVFIEIINRLRKQLPTVNAVIYGKGPEEDRLKQLITAYDLRDRIVLPGETKHSKLLKEMVRTKIFLHTSRYEGLGVVCIEALYAGAHVISFCRPMDKDIPQWHIVDTIDEMAQKAISLLLGHPMEHNPVMPFAMGESVEKIMQLFGK